MKSRGEGQGRRSGTTKDNPWLLSLLETEDADNYRNCFVCGECLNVFLGNCVVSALPPPSWKNKEERHRTAGENGAGDGEGSGRRKSRGREKKWREMKGRTKRGRGAANRRPSSVGRGGDAFHPSVGSSSPRRLAIADKSENYESPYFSWHCACIRRRSPTLHPRSLLMKAK